MPPRRLIGCWDRFQRTALSADPRGEFQLTGDRIAPGRPAGSGTRTLAGISVLDPQLFAGATPGRFPLAPLLRAAAERGAVTGEEYGGSWTDVGTPERLQALDAELKARPAPIAP